MAIQNQFIITDTHQGYDIPEANNCIYYYNIGNRLCLMNVDVITTDFNTAKGGILQSNSQNAIGAVNAGGGNQNGSGSSTVIAFNNVRFDIQMGSDSDGYYLDLGDNSTYNGTSVGIDDGNPCNCGPAAGGIGAQSAYPSVPLSLGMFFKYVASSVSGTYATIWGGNGTSAPSSGINITFAINSANNKMVAIGYNSSFSTSVRNTFSFTFSQNTLYSVVFTMTTGGVISMYVNGSLDSSYTESTTINDVGERAGGPANAFLGANNSYIAFLKGSFCGKVYKQAAWTTLLSSSDVSVFHSNGPN